MFQWIQTLTKKIRLECASPHAEKKLVDIVVSDRSGGELTLCYDFEGTLKELSRLMVMRANEVTVGELADIAGEMGIEYDVAARMILLMMAHIAFAGPRNIESFLRREVEHKIATAIRDLVDEAAMYGRSLFGQSFTREDVDSRSRYNDERLQRITKALRSRGRPKKTTRITTLQPDDIQFLKRIREIVAEARSDGRKITKSDVARTLFPRNQNPLGTLNRTLKRLNIDWKGLTH